MKSLTAQLFIDIINREMEMPPDSVWLRDENRLIPNDNGLYIIVGMMNSFPVCNTVYMKEETTNNKPRLSQVSECQMQENIQIDVLSRSNDARTRNIEVLMALQSFYAQQVMQNNNFKIFRNPRSFINASSAEGGSNINRYSITIAAMVWYRKTKLLNSPYGDYYDDFTQRVDDEATIGTDKPLIEFEINSGGIVP